MTVLYDFFSKLLAGTVVSAAGLACFITLFYRCLVRIRHQSFKRRLIVAAFLIATVPTFITGYMAGISVWTIVPAVFVTVFFSSAIALRVVFKKIHRADPPVAVINKSVSIGQPLTTFDFSIEHYQATLNNSSGNALRIAHLTDLHLHEKARFDYYNKVIDATNGFNPDLVFITGDIMTEDAPLSLLDNVLGRFQAKLGIFTVFGNHDCWFGGEKIKSVLDKLGIIHLGNSCVTLNTGKGDNILLCGYEGPWNHSEIKMPQQNRPETVFFLTHTPDNVFRLKELGAGAVFAGHCHAGQVRVPWIGSIVTPSIYGRRFEHGHFMVGDTHLFVSSGVGSGAPGFRLYCQPDVFVIDFK